mgnify:CR=1 FL=1
MLCGSGCGLQAQTDVWPVWAGQEDCAAVVDSVTEKGVVRLTEVKSPTLAVFRPQVSVTGWVSLFARAEAISYWPTTRREQM